MAERPKTRWWEQAARVAHAVETSLVVAILGSLILFGAAQIVLRNLFSFGFAWGDGLSRIAVLWLALLGGVAASRDGRHITMGAIMRWLPPRAAAVAGVVADLIGAGVSAAFAWYSGAFVSDSREFGDLLLNDVPAWWLQSIMPAAFALIAVQFLLHGILRVKRPSAPTESSE